MFSCEFCEISKNAFSLEQLWTTASTSCVVVSDREDYPFKAEKQLEGKKCLVIRREDRLSEKHLAVIVTNIKIHAILKC